MEVSGRGPIGGGAGDLRPGFHRGRRLPVHQDVMDSLVVAAPPGDPVILSRFARPLENRIGWVVTLGTVVLLLGVSTGANNLGGTPL